MVIRGEDSLYLFFQVNGRLCFIMKNMVSSIKKLKKLACVRYK